MIFQFIIAFKTGSLILSILVSKVSLEDISRLETIFIKNLLKVSAMSKSPDITSSKSVGVSPFTDIFFFLFVKRGSPFSKKKFCLSHLFHSYNLKILSSLALLNWHKDFSVYFMLSYLYHF